MADTAVLQLHLAPLEPIEIGELTGALSAISHQYDIFSKAQDYDNSDVKTRLLVSGISPGSIDINFVADMATTLAVAATPVITDVQIISGFAGQIKDLLDKFSFFGKSDQKSPDVVVKDCNDAINIVNYCRTRGNSNF
jgi:hypothetical protein